MTLPSFSVPDFEIVQLQIGSMRNFIYAITSGTEAFIIDPQKDLNPWEEYLERKKTKLAGVLLTHTHHDHIAGLPFIEAKYAVPIYVHAQDAIRLSLDRFKNCSISHIHDGQKLKLGKISIEVLHTPGHSSGECCFLIHEGAPQHLFTGDTIFVGEVGRTDLETGSTAELFHTIQRIKGLPRETVIYPGHDYGPSPTSTVGEEATRSAAFQCKTIEELDALP